eukprot:jgi/Mesen1/5602/ME000282S04751
MGVTETFLAKVRLDEVSGWHSDPIVLSLLLLVGSIASYFGLSRYPGGDLGDLRLVAPALAVAGSLTAAFWIAYIYLLRPFYMKSLFKKLGIPGPGYKPWYGSMAELTPIIKGYVKKENQAAHDGAGVEARKILPAHRHWFTTHGSVYHWFLGPMDRIVITDPVMLKEMLMKSGYQGDFGKSPFPRHMALKFLGNSSLLIANGEGWHHTRKLLNPAFYHQELSVMFKHAIEAADRNLGAWEKKIDANGGKLEQDMHRAFNHLTLDVAGSSFLGTHDFEDPKTADFLYDAFMGINLGIFYNLFFKGQLQVPLFSYLPLPSNLKIAYLTRGVRGMLRNLIKKKKANLALATSKLPQDQPDMLARLVAAQQSYDDYQLSDTEVEDQAMTFLFAGHETTTSLLSWTSLLLARNPEWREKARQEVLEICGENGPIEWDHLWQMKNLQMILFESMRLYPPAPLFMREVYGKDVKLGKYTLPEGIQIQVNIYLCHHDPRYWEDPEEFKPERFADGQAAAAKHPNSYFPFGFGPRSCIGKNVAMAEGKLVIAEMLRRFDWSISPNYRHVPYIHFSLYPKNGMPMVITRRERPATK